MTTLLLLKITRNLGSVLGPTSHNPAKTILGVASVSILSRDPDLSSKPPNTLGKWLAFEKNDG